VASKRRPKRRRDYAAEYQRRKARARALLGESYTTSAARGHPRRDKGELGVRELAQLRRAAAVLSPGETLRQVKIRRRPAMPKMRVDAAARVAEFAGVKRPTGDWHARNRDKTNRQRFVEAFLRLNMGSEQRAYLLWFSS